VPSPNPGGAAHRNVLSRVAADTADDVWAVGYWGVSASGTVTSRGLILHWDGSRWTKVAPPRGVEGLTGIARSAPDDVWAVGTASSKPVAIHWDGRSWSVVPTAHAGVRATLVAIASLGTAGVWAVGSWKPRRLVPWRTLIERWDGSAWRREPSPRVGTKGNGLFGIAAAPGFLLTVGYSDGWAAPLALERCPT